MAIPQSGSHVLVNLIASCIVTLFDRGKTRGLSARFNSLQELMAHKEQDTRLGALCVFGALTLRFGNQFIEDKSLVVGTWSKVLKKYEDTPTKHAVLLNIATLYNGRCVSSRPEAAAEKILSAVVKLSGDKSDTVRSLAADCMLAIVEGVDDAAVELDEFLPQIIKNLKDPVLVVRHRYSEVLGQALSASWQKSASKREAVKKRLGKSHYEVLTLDDAIATIERFFAKTSSASTRACLAFALASLLSRTALSEDQVPRYAAIALGFLARGKPVASDKDGRHGAHIISYVLREGLLAPLRERGLETVAKYLLSVINRRRDNGVTSEYQLLVCLEQLCFVFQELGPCLEMCSDITDMALEALLSLFTDTRRIIRVLASQCFRQLVRAAPSHMATWISVLYKIVAIHTHDLSSVDASIDQAILCSLHGHLYALASLTAAVPDALHGVPSSLLSDIFDNAESVILIPCGAPDSPSFGARQSVKEAGWLLVTALIGLGKDWVHTHLSRLFALWKPLGKGLLSGTVSEQALLSALSLRLQELIALRAYVAVHKHRLKDVTLATKTNQLLDRVVNGFCATTFKLVRDKNIDKGSPEIHRAYTAITAVLLDIYAALPPDSFAASVKPLLQLVVHEFSSQSTRPGSIIHQLLSVCDKTLEEIPCPHLRHFADLNDADKCAQPVDYTWAWTRRPEPYSFPEDSPRMWQQGPDPKDPFASAYDCDALRPTSFGETARTSIPGYSPGDVPEEASMPTYERGANSAIRFFIVIFSGLTPHHKEQLTQHFVKLVLQHKTKATAASPHVISNIIAAVLGVCRALCARGLRLESEKAAEALLAVCMELLDWPVSHVRRAAGECLGLLALLEGEVMVAKAFGLLQHLDSASPPAPPAMLAGGAFALACMHRYAGYSTWHRDTL